MSKIVSPYPPMGDRNHKPPPGSSWWRFRLAPNEDNNILIMCTDATGEDMTTASWCSWEFFDGHDTLIDTGFDKPTKVRITHTFASGFLDVLSVGPPTPSPDWVAITDGPRHPDDTAEDL